MHIFDKTLNFCYGHRVYSPELDIYPKENLQCKCKHLHGHEARVQIFLEFDIINVDTVLDCSSLDWLDQWINKFIDHRFIIDINDPLYARLINKDVEIVDVLLPDTGLFVGFVPKLDNIKKDALKDDLYGSFFIVNFIPTFENLSSWIFGIVESKMKPLNINIVRVEWQCTYNSKISYYPPHVEES